MTNEITVPLTTMEQLAHMTTQPIHFGDDMTIKPILHGFMIVDTFAGYETYVRGFEEGYTVTNNDGATPYTWSREGYIQIYKEDQEGFYSFIFTV